ncbi:hypothetical protein NPX13_g4988 [Xylaria arbuscula]|uniref:ATP-dependent DNA helicase n=1 Tax=Xylaria arbuscula TaxID=114810 RepID=A0A9W8NFE5_9PEZI|nr:hypothetical protein NPX13_g4988 [Xylaria arbuscula]
MSRREPVRVPIDEIRRTLESLDRQHARNGAQRRRGTPQTIMTNSVAPQTPGQRPREPTRIPLEEVRRTLADWKRQRADERALQRCEAFQQATLEPQEDKVPAEPRNEPIDFSLREIRRVSHNLDQQYSEERDRQREGVLQQTVPTPRNKPLMVPFDEIRRIMEDLDRQHKQNKQEASRRRAMRNLTHDIIATHPHPDLGTSLNTTTHTTDKARGQPSRRAEMGLRLQPVAAPPPIHPFPRTAPPPKRRGDQHELPTTPTTRSRHPQKKPRLTSETVRLQRESISAMLRYHESCFRQKEEASLTRSWCKEVPLALQVETSKSFYQAFTDERTLPISHCVFCYRKLPPCDLIPIAWKEHLSPPLLQATRILQDCKKCFPSERNSTVSVCHKCRTSLENGKLPRLCSVNNMDIGCEHRYPEELSSLSPVEERLIALQSAFGYITKFTVDNKTRSGISYRKHVKGHIVVFPNKVEDLVATVLPHPLLQTIENIHVSWSGASKPGPADVGHLLQVRKSRVRAALSWLQRNNPLYGHITINNDEMDGWHYAEGSSVPSMIMERMQREEPSTVEKTQTDHIVPDTDRGLEENGFTSIEELIASVPTESNDDPHTSDSTSMPIEHSRPSADAEPSVSVLGAQNTSLDSEAIYATSSSAMFPIDGPAVFDEADKLSFLSDAIQTSRDAHPAGAGEYGIGVQTTGQLPFIRVERGADFADNLHPDFFPRTFPTLFPWGKGGPKIVPDPNCCLHGSIKPTRNHSLTYWGKYVLQRHGGRFATHPVFCFLIFNTLLRSSNRRISMVRMSRRSFEKVEQVCANLTLDQLRRAGEEMRGTGFATDPDITLLLRELFVFGHAQPLSNESRLLMRRKIQALCIRMGMPAIWFTVNPNDINNPVKMRLSVHRLHDHDKAKELLADLSGRYDRIALSTMDPVSSAIFFHREVSLFFDKYVRAGQESVFGRISHYYATVETNDRGSLHLHGLLWLDGNMQLPSLVDDMANPDEREYRASVVRYINSVFHECLDEEAGKATRQDRKPIHPVEETMNNTDALTSAFENEANYIAYCCQIHSHTYTCIKYSLKALAQKGSNRHSRTACRFKAPWKIVEQTGFTEDGLLEIHRNHPLVNRYNKAMAVGLRHNHDISLILTKTKGLAMVFYITNYATKLNTPMWKRLVLAAEVLQQRHESSVQRHQIPDPVQGDDHRSAVSNEARQFLMRVANRVFSERELSAVEVCYHLLGYQTDFTNVPNWSFLHLDTLYWAIFRRWPHLRRLAGMDTDIDEPLETVNLREHGRTLSYFEAYAIRGELLADICFYDYIAMVTSVRRKDHGHNDDEFHISFQGLSEGQGWTQRLRQPHEYAVPIFQGFISNDHNDEHPAYFKRNSVLHLALFVPWQDFLSGTDGDITDIWLTYEASLSPRLCFYVSNISLLSKSAEDARKDAKLWASRSEGDDTVDIEFPVAEGDYANEPAATAEHHQAYTALLHALQNAVQNSDATKGSSVLQGLIQDLCQENAAEEGRPFVQRYEDFYKQIRHRQNSPLFQYPTPSGENIQAVAKTQDMLHLRMLDEIESGPESAAQSRDDGDIDDMLARHWDSEIPFLRQGRDQVTEGPRMLVDINPATSFAELARLAASNYTLNSLQSMALQLVCQFLDKYTADPDSAGQHLQYTGGPGGTGKSRIVDALKTVFAARGQSQLIQITGTSGSAAAQIGGTTVHSACALDVHRSRSRQPLAFPEAKKWRWKQKLVLVIDEVSMLGGATLYDISCNLQALRDCHDKPFGGTPIVLLMGDFYQFAPVLETSLLVNKMVDPALTPVSQTTISHHQGYMLWHMFRTVVLLEEQVRARDDPQLGALLDRIRAGVQTRQDLDLLNTKLVDRSQISFNSGLRAITPLNRNRWSLNMEAVVDWARFNKRHISIFVSMHTWRCTPSQDELARTIEQGDNSNCKVPGIFFYAQGMPVVVNKNIYTGLKIVNGAEFTAADIIPDPKYLGYHLADDVTIHFGPPLGILLQSTETENLTIPSLPPGTVLIRPISYTVDPTSSHFRQDVCGSTLGAARKSCD